MSKLEINQSVLSVELPKIFQSIISYSKKSFATPEHFYFPANDYAFVSKICRNAVKIEMVHIYERTIRRKTKYTNTQRLITKNDRAIANPSTYFRINVSDYIAEFAATDSNVPGPLIEGIQSM